MKDHTHRLTFAFSTIVCLLYLAVFTLINFRGFCRFCTPDMYSDTYLVRVMWESGSIFPENWIFGNQFYVISTPVLAAAIYGLCGSINLSMVLATAGMTMLILLSFWWMLRPFASRCGILLGTAVLLGSVIGPGIVTTIEGQILYLMASYYAGYLIVLFVVFGDYLRTMHAPARRGGIALALALLLSFCTGMQSLRQTALMILPLLGIEALRLLRLWIRCTPFSEWNRSAALRVALYTASNLAGRAAIRLLDPNHVTMYGELSFNGLSQVPDRLSTCLRALRSITGLKYLQGDTLLAGIPAMILVAVTAFALIRLFLQREAWSGCELLMVLFGCSVLSVLAVSVVVSIDLRSIYIFSWYPLAALAAVVLFTRLRSRGKGLLAGVLLVCLMGNLYLSYGADAKQACSDVVPPEQKVARYLTDEGYTRVYGPWEYVAGVAVWTDGQVASGGWFGSVCQVVPYITPTDIFSGEDNANACYLTTSASVEQQLLDYAASQGAVMSLLTRFDGTGYSLYSSSKQLMYFGED